MSNLDDEYWGRTNYEMSSGRLNNGTWGMFPNRGTEPQGLTDLRKTLGTNIMSGLQDFDPNSWKTAQNLANQARGVQSDLLGQLGGDNGLLAQNRNLVNEITDIARNGTIPTNISNTLNASVNQGLQNSMGTMLNNLASRGVLNSSVTTAGTNQLAQAAADSYNRNYLTAYQTVLNGLGQGLQGSQGNLTSLLSTLGTVGSIPSQAYNNVGAQLQSPYTFWKDWQNFYQTDEPYDTIVTQKSNSCITGDTLVTLENGQQIPVGELKDGDKIRVWDFERGCITSTPLTGFFKNNVDEGLDIIRVEFEDGSNVGVIVEHLFFDLNEGKFIAINSDSQEYVGHEFAKVTPEGKVVPVKVSKIYNDGKAAQTFGPQPEGHWNYLAGGFISGNDGQLGMCNMFDFNTNAMTYDAEKKAEDLVTYGKLSYDVFDGIISRSTFYSNHFDECSVAFGKGLARCDDFRAYIAKFAGYFFDEGSRGTCQ